MKKTRDARRMADLQSLNQALQYAELDLDPSSQMGSSSVVYVSLPSSNSDCSGLGLPALDSPWTYHCSSQDNYRKADGSGWVPVNFTSLKAVPNALTILPIDPLNAAASPGYYYTYITGGSWELTALFESTSYRQQHPGYSTSTTYTLGTYLGHTPSPISMRQVTGEGGGGGGGGGEGGGKANGQACSTGSECSSGNCVTGYCCSSPSCNTCYSCSTGSCAAQTCDGAAATLLGCTQGSEACRYCNAGTCGYYTSGQHGCSSGQTCNSSGQCAQQYALSVSKTGTGSGTVTSNPSGINCGSTCQYSFNSGTSVTLTASAEGGSVFTGWSGEGCSGTGTCIVSMTQARLVTANFMLCGGYAWGGYCWYKGESLQNCNTVCQGHGATCVLDGKTGTDANDNSNCDLCHHWEPGFTCIETSYGGEPQIEYSDSRCRRRPLTQAGNCSFTNDSYGRRICACSY